MGKTITIRIDDATYKKIKLAAESEKRTISNFMEYATVAYLENSSFISDEELKEIGKLGKRLEEHFGTPQDIEWAIDEDASFPENVILLQTRPEVISKQNPVDQVIDMMVSRF